jgi:probable rRNA maturation factor
MALTILIQNTAWKQAWPEARTIIRRAVKAVFTHQHEKFTDLAIVLMDDASITPLNYNYRGKNAPTNVLSFANDEEEADGDMLGDVLLAYETIDKEAREQKKALSDHATHLVVHGVLHLLGYDHKSEAEATVMEAHEIAILATLGVANPYQIR